MLTFQEIYLKINIIIDLNYFCTERNSFTGEVPTNLGKMKDLKTLNAAVNNLHGTVPSEIGNLDALENLELGKSKINKERMNLYLIERCLLLIFLY